MRPRDEAVAKSAVAALLEPDASAERKRGASAVLRSLGIDEYTAMAEAREAVKPSGTAGRLRKDAGVPGAITVRAPMGEGGTIALEMTPAEAVSLVNAVHDAIAGRSA